MRYGSLFTGIGGFDLGLERAGLECAWQVEIDERCRDVLARHWPDVKRYGDVRDVGKRNLETVDLICGGFPCQDLSMAGKRGGLAGERSGLWFEFHRVVAELEPRWVIVENVPGLLSSNGGADFAVLLRGLVECGYGVAWRVLDAQYFGVAQRRRRVFVVGSLGDGRAAQVLFECEGGAWDTAPGREAGEGIAAPLTRGSATGSGVNEPGRRREDDVNLVQHALSARNQCNDPDGEHFVVTPPLRAEGGVTSSPTLNKNLSDLDFLVAPTLTAPDPNAPAHDGKRQDGSRTDKIPITLAFTERTRADGRNLESQEELAYAVTNPGSGGRTHSRQIMDSYGVRRLTPTECERLQGFPDGWTAGQSDSARYRQLGNAVAVPVAAWLGRLRMGTDRNE